MHENLSTMTEEELLRHVANQQHISPLEAELCVRLSRTLDALNALENHTPRPADIDERPFGFGVC